MAEMQILQEQKFALGLTPHGVALAAVFFKIVDTFFFTRPVSPH